MSERSRKGPGGLRDLATLQTLVHDRQPLERHQIVNRFSRLENERARLERELEMWRSRMKATEDKLAKIYGQIDVLRPLLMEEPANVPAGRRARGHARPQASTEVSGAALRPARSITLDY